MLFFWGLLWAKYEINILDYVNKNKVSFLLFLSIVCILYMLGIILDIDNYLPLRFSAMITVVVVSIYYFVRHGSNSRLLSWFGNLSYEIYLIHGIFIYLYKPYIENYLLYFILCILSTIITSLTVHLFCNRLLGKNTLN